jgi:hypothetical protein
VPISRFSLLVRAAGVVIGLLSQNWIYTNYIIYRFFSLVTNLINGSPHVAGGCAVFASLTSLNIWAAYWILPVVLAASIGTEATVICEYIFSVLVHFFHFQLVRGALYEPGIELYYLRLVE